MLGRSRHSGRGKEGVLPRVVVQKKKKKQTKRHRVVGKGSELLHMPGTFVFLLAGRYPWGAGEPGIPSTDGRRERPGRASRYACGERGWRAWYWSPALYWEREELRSIHASSPKAPGWAGGEQEAARAVLLGPVEDRGGWGRLGGHTGLCFESSSCWCRAARWRVGVRLSKGAVRSAGGSPGAYRTPVRPRAASFPGEGRDAQALLSAGLSPRAVASSLKEGRSLGLGAQQRCISLARREGQPSGCGSFVFPDCRPARTSSSASGV